MSLCVVFAGVIQRVYFEYELQGSETMEKIVESLQEDWLAVCHLYQVVSDFAHIYAGKSHLCLTVVSLLHQRLQLKVVVGSYDGQAQELIYLVCCSLLLLQSKLCARFLSSLWQ